MLNGSAMERADMIVAERSLQIKQAKEQSQALEQNQREKKEIKPKQEQQKRGFKLG